MPQPLTVYIDEDLTVQLFRVDADDEPEVITSRTYASQVRDTADSTSALFSFTPTITSGGGGIVSLTVASTATASLEPTDAVWSVTEDGSTLFELPCAIRRPATR